jgi:hypothetical protein
MMQRTATAPIGPADDAHAGLPVAGGFAPWSAIPCAILFLVALAGAFMVGLVVVGILAPVICGADLLRRRVRSAQPTALLTAKSIGR